MTHALNPRVILGLCAAAVVAWMVTLHAQSSTPFSGTPAALPGTVQAENFDHGGAEVAYRDKDAGNKGGAYRSTDVDIQATADTGGGYNVGWMAAGEWLQYTVNVAAAGTYTLQLRVASAQQGGTLHVAFDGVDRTGPMTIPATGSYQAWTTISRAVTLPAGTQRMRVVLDAPGPSGGVGNLNWVRLVSSAAPATLFRQPYLQQVTSAGAILVWATTAPGRGDVRYQAAGQPQRSAAATTTLFTRTQTGLSTDFYQHVATLGPLSPSTEYAYDVLLDGAILTASTTRFRTAPPEGTGSVRFIAFGDSGVGSSEQRQLAARMAADTFDLAIHTGDVAYGFADTAGGGTHQTLHDWFFAIYRDWLGRRPFYPSIGNHDDETAFSRPYRDVFVLPPHGAASGYPDHAERFYSFDHGPAHFVALDTERAFQDPQRRAAQLAWLDSDLASTAQPWKIVYFHRSPYSSSAGHGSDLAVRQAIVPVLERHGVQLVISGHDHLYERSTPWRQTTGAVRPITYVVTGGGGAKLYASGRAAWTVTSISAFHYVRANVTDCALYLVALGRDGQKLDGMTLDRCAQDRDAHPPSVAITSPAAGATARGVVTVTASASDDQRVEKVDLWVDGVLRGIDAAAPYAFTWDSRTVPDGARQIQVRAYDIAGRITTAARTVQVANGAAAGDIVLYASDAAALSGNWARLPSTSGAGGQKLSSANRGWYATTPRAAPADFFEMSFTPQANTPYRVWLRLRAADDWRENDSVWVQFSGAVNGSGSPLWRIGSTAALLVNLEDCQGCGVSGWGWQDGSWWVDQTAVVSFPSSGPQTIRIQTREDGVDVDQVVLSPATYFGAAPGATKQDATIVPR